MPVYEFLCSKCTKSKEVTQKYTDPPPVCSKCGKDMVRQISKSSFALKGSGWFRDGYSRTKNK